VPGLAGSDERLHRFQLLPIRPGLTLTLSALHPLSLFPTVYDAVGTWLWTTNSAGKGTPPRRFIMQGDGNALIADSANKATWATYTAGM
jgi:hypothetical protein